MRYAGAEANNTSSCLLLVIDILRDTIFTIVGDTLGASTIESFKMSYRWLTLHRVDLYPSRGLAQLPLKVLARGYKLQGSVRLLEITQCLSYPHAPIL